MDDLDTSSAGGAPQGAVVRLVVPSPSQVLTAACHARGVTGRLLLDDRTAATVLQRLDIDLYVHPVWWLDATTCPGSDVTLWVADVDRFVDELDDRAGHEPDACTCGRIALGEVVASVTDPAVRQRAFDLHLRAMTQAFDHYWAGDTAVGGDALDLADGVCPLCLTEGTPHVAAVGAEAELLAEEFGAVVAAHAATVVLGAARYDAGSSGAAGPMIHPCVDDQTDG